MPPELDFWIDEYDNDLDDWITEEKISTYNNTWVSEIKQRFYELKKKKAKEAKEKDITEYGFEEDLFKL